MSPIRPAGDRLFFSIGRSFILFAAFGGLFESADADGPAEATKTKLEIAIDQSLENYKVYAGESQVPLKPIDVLTWNNPVAGSSGKFRTVLFLQDGQAKSVCCIWKSASSLYHEFGSLTRESLRGEMNGKVKWQMDEGVRMFLPIPDAKAPADDRRLRLLQLKQLIKRFAATELRNRKREPDRVPLRLMPTPLYRYEKESETIVDGAVFCFAHTTDPETLVVIEAVKTGDSLQWQYAFVRRTTLPVEGELDGTVVWNTDQVGYNAFNQIRFGTVDF